MITPAQRHHLLMAERTRDVDAIRAAIDDVLSDDVTALDIEMVFRAAGSPVFLISDGGHTVICIGHDQMLAELGRAGMNPAANRKALAGLK